MVTKHKPEKRKPVKKLPVKKAEASGSWAVCGFDVAMVSICAAAYGWDSVMGKPTKVVFAERRFKRDVHFFTRLRTATYAREIVWELIAEMKLFKLPFENIHIAVEEPWPMGMMGGKKSRFQSGWAKQQAQMQGAVMVALVRDYSNVYEINSVQWRKVCADALGITTHHTKWYSSAPKEWALQEFKVPDFPDFIQSRDGLIPRPEGSKAQTKQVDDRYPALAMAKWVEIEAGLSF